MSSDFQRELEGLINKYSMENESNTPDFILAGFLYDCLGIFNKTTKLREDWYGIHLGIGQRDKQQNKVDAHFIKGLPKIEKLRKEGHSHHCACRIVWGDGECTCRKGIELENLEKLIREQKED